MKKTLLQTVEIVLSFIIGIIFIYSSIHKIHDPGEFAKFIYGYDIFPDSSINFLAVMLPFFELYAGLALVFRIFMRPGLLIINMLLLGFILILGYNLARGHQFDCGCFSFEKNQTIQSTISLLVRDIILFILTAFLYLRCKK